MPASKTARNGVAAVIIALACVALALMWWTGQRAIALQIPITLALAVDDTVWVHSHRVLHELDADGHRVNRVPTENLGLPQPVLHLHAVRRDDLLVSAGEPMRVYRCAPSQRACRLADAGYIERFGEFKHAVWLGANADGSRIVVSDNAAHRVAVLDGDGALLAAAGGSIGRFHYPGQPVWVGEKTIWLASGDQRRIERFEFDGSAIGEPVQMIALEKSDLSLAGRTWPMALAPLGDGHWWAVVKVHDLSDGGLARFSEQGRFGASARLPEGADVTAVTRLGDRLIVADLEGPALHRLTLAGTEAAPFGGDEFQAELRAHGSEIAQWYRWQEWAKWALIGSPILGIGLLLLLGEHVSQAPAHVRAAALLDMSSAGVSAGEVVIGVSERYRKMTRLMLWIVLPQLLVMPLVFFVLVPVDLTQAVWQGVMALLLALTWGMGWVIFWVATWVLSLRLCVARGVLRYERNGRAVTSVRLADCYTDGRWLLLGARLLEVRRPFFPLLDRNLVQSHVFAQMPESQWLTSGRLQWRFLKAAWQALVAKARSLLGN